jgi:radical SAM-linked protein
MKVRIKFQKYGSMKFVGHLDVMRYFQKMFRRAKVDNEYTKGFSPHQIMSFAAPLGVGLTSDAEYVDVQLLSGEEPAVMIKRMNEAMTEGFRVIGYHLLLEREENKKNVPAMSLVASADYLIFLKDGYSLGDKLSTQQEFKEAFINFMNQAEIIIGKKTKTSEKDVDIKPMISFAAFCEEEYEDKRCSTLSESILHKEKDAGEFLSSESKADTYENGIKVYLQLDTGSSANLKPELVIEAFHDYLGLPYQRFAWQVHRLEVYTKLPEDGKLAALDQVER